MGLLHTDQVVTAILTRTEDHISRTVEQVERLLDIGRGQRRAVAVHDDGLPGASLKCGGDQVVEPFAQVVPALRRQAHIRGQPAKVAFGIRGQKGDVTRTRPAPGA